MSPRTLLYSGQFTGHRSQLELVLACLSVSAPTNEKTIQNRENTHATQAPFT